MVILLISIVVLAMGVIGLFLYLYQKSGFLFITHCNWDGSIKQPPLRETVPDKAFAKWFLFRMIPETINQDATEIEFVPASDRVIIRFLAHDEWQTFDLFINEQQFYVQLIENGVLTHCDGTWYLSTDYYKLVIRQIINMSRYEIRDETLPLTFQIHITLSNDRPFVLHIAIDQSEHGEHVQIRVSKPEPETPLSV